MTVFERTKHKGTPMIVWEAGRIKEIPIEQLALPNEKPTGEMKDEPPSRFTLKIKMSIGGVLLNLNLI